MWRGGQHGDGSASFHAAADNRTDRCGRADSRSGCGDDRDQRNCGRARSVGPNIALTPSFIGAQPGQYADASDNTVRPLGDIDDAFALINVLDATQQKAAILGTKGGAAHFRVTGPTIVKLRAH